MITIKKIFWCDHIEEGQFGKLNISGLIPTNKITFNTIPYSLISYLVISGETDEKLDDLHIKIIFKNRQNKIMKEVNCDLSSTKEINHVAPLFLINPINFTINYYGCIEIEVFHKGKKIYREIYEIIKGAAPYSKLKKHLPLSKIFSGDKNTDEDFVINLLGTSNQSLKIFDNYIEPKKLNHLLSKVPSSIEIKIVTSPKHKKIFLSDRSLCTQFPKSKIRTSTKVHDRFVIINDSEYYHFGHSLKDIANKKLSRFSKITGQKEIKEYEDFFNKTWQISQKI